MPEYTSVNCGQSNGTINEKLDWLFSTFTEQKQENTQLQNALEELSNQVSILQDQVSSDISNSGQGRF